MERYKNIGGNSGVASYEIFDDSVTVRFSTGAIYIYSYRSAGKENIERMKVLAMQGHGLNSFIMRNVKNSYE
ncbi:Uncharacterised protein [BD1-7 clade bacterium]|uniref:KTSC domain-containing protein n=1 Tax=BD1-7 clade bacterium TaxID=2029982 RepID=A0A5S9NWR8_9GAMM|nr:Uncharacterised protein [BD1-7 clade bacterium]CAA0095880.1 Uncharacterised protein [BD1-7 clade bacterium]